MRRLSIVQLVGCLIAGALWAFAGAAVSARQTATPDANALEISFDTVYPLALEFRDPVRAALEQNPDLLAANIRLTVSAYRDIPGWARVTLVPTSYVENSWANIETVTPGVVEIILWQVGVSQWNGAMIGSPAYAAVAASVPRAFVDTTTPLPPAEPVYKFPWQSGQAWWAITGWHDGNAIDFEPSLSARYAVLASQSGYLRELCSDGYQSLLQIQHADGRATYYLHVTLSLNVRRRLLDHNVRQGQYLGEIIGRAPFRTACGQGYSRHLHFVVSDRTMMIENYPASGIAASASCCSNPPVYVSSNRRVDDSR